MTNQTEPKPYACYDFTTGGIIVTPTQAHHVLQDDYAHWLAEQEQVPDEKASTDPRQIQS